MKKLLSLILVAILALSLFAACTQPADTQAPTTDAPADTEAQSEAEAEPVEMETITVWSNSGGTKDQFTAIIDNYNETTGKEKGIFIEYTVYGSDYNTVAENALATDQGADIIQLASSLWHQALANGHLAYLEDFEGSDEFIAEREEYLRPSNYHEGKLVQVPFSSSTIKMVYNKDLFVAAGIVDDNGEAMPPKTWDDVVEYAKLITDPAKNTYGIALPMAWGAYYNFELFRPFVGSVGNTQWNSATGQFDFTAMTPAFEFLQQIAEDKTYFPGAESLDNDAARAQFSAGLVGMKMAASWDVGVFNTQFPVEGEWGVCPIPVLDENDAYKEYAEITSMFSITNTGKDKNADKVFEVYKWLHSDEVLTELYKQSAFLPYSTEIVEMAGEFESAIGWQEFADTSNSYFYASMPSVSPEGLTFQDVTMQVFQGGISIEDAVADLDERYNAQLAADIESGKVNIDTYMDTNTPVAR